jgi:signal transduction histidine kinase
MTSIAVNKKLNLGFWHFQIIGWIVFEIFIQFQNLIKPAYIDYVNHYGYLKIIAWWTCYDVVALFITTVFRYIYRYLINRRSALWKNLLVAFLLSLTSAGIWAVAGYYVSEAFKIRYGDLSFSGIVQTSTYLIFILLGWSLIYFGIKYWVRMSEETARADKASLMAQSAQLKMLRYQLNPHFLFNSLNSILALIDEDKKASKEMVSELAEFLRYTLLNKDSIETSVRQELEAIRHYLSIEKKRFEEKLEVRYETDPLTEEIMIPSFVLHQLVENAVKYGIKTSTVPLKILIRTSLSGNDLEMTVCNTGSWITPSENRIRESTGTGLENIRLRLDQKFPDKFVLTTSVKEGLVVVALKIKNVVPVK